MDFKVLKGSYKSICYPFIWKDMPQFCVITGENGTGKTQCVGWANS